MQVGCLVEVPFVYWEGTGRSRRLAGISINQMQYLATKYKFEVDFRELNGTYDTVVAYVGGQDVNSSNSGLIDVAIQAFTATGIRSLTARQTASPLDSVLVYIRKKAPFLRDLESVFQAFILSLWVLLFATLFFLADNLAFIDMMRELWPQRRRQVNPTAGPMSFLSIVQTFQKIIQNDKRKVGRMFWNQVFNLGSLLFGQLPIRPSDDAPSRVLYILFKAFAFGLAAFYTALLVNQFQAKPEHTLLSMEKFCKVSQAEGVSLENVFVPRGTSQQAFILNYFRENAKLCPNIGKEVINLFDNTVPEGGANLCQDHAHCLELVKAGDAYATLRDDAEANWRLSHGSCNLLEIVGITKSPAATTWILPLDESYSALAQTLSNAILLARDDGSFDRISREAIDKDGCLPDDLNKVSIKNVSGFLVPMAAMYVMAWFIQLFKCARTSIPFVRRWSGSGIAIWGEDMSVCNCRLLYCNHISHAPLHIGAQTSQFSSSTSVNHSFRGMKDAVIVRPLRTSEWSHYAQPSEDSSDGDCPSVP